MEEEKKRKAAAYSASRFLSGGTYLNELYTESSQRVAYIKRIADLERSAHDAELGGVFSFFTRVFTPAVVTAMSVRPDLFGITPDKKPPTTGNKLLGALSTLGALNFSKKPRNVSTVGKLPTQKTMNKATTEDGYLHNIASNNIERGKWYTSKNVLGLNTGDAVSSGGRGNYIHSGNSNNFTNRILFQSDFETDLV